MEQKKCENLSCNNIVEGKTKNGGIRRYCSKKCSNACNSKNSREKFRETCKEKYGGCGAASKTIKDKMQNTNIKKYGVVSYLSTDEKKIKTKITNIEKYGEEHHLRVKEILDKQQLTVFEKYGVKNISQLFETKEKKVETTLRNYGVTHHFLDEQILENRKNTCIEKYGTEYPTGGYNFRDYILPSGKTVRIQGFENKALDELLKIYTEDEILLGKDVPRIRYIRPDGTEHNYYPDIYIPKDNLIIEVKSYFTYGLKPEILKLKENATRAAGYNFEYKIYK